jgi:hypothetical protein
LLKLFEYNSCRAKATTLGNTVMATVMADDNVTEMKVAMLDIADGNDDGNGQWRR